VSRELEQLRAEVALREASLADASRELASGELSEHEYALIEQRERAGIEKAQARLDALRASDVGVLARRVRKRWRLLVGLGFLGAALVILLVSAISPRQSGNSITGGIALSNAQKVQQYLDEAQADIANGDVATALDAYESVLTIDPKNVPALTQVGWLDFSAGSSDQNLKVMRVGVKDLRDAIALAPKSPAPRLYYAIVADSTPGNHVLARSEFEVFLDLHPSKGQLAIAAPFLAKFGLHA